MICTSDMLCCPPVSQGSEQEYMSRHETSLSGVKYPFEFEQRAVHYIFQTSKWREVGQEAARGCSLSLAGSVARYKAHNALSLDARSIGHSVRCSELTRAQRPKVVGLMMCMQQNAGPFQRYKHARTHARIQ